MPQALRAVAVFMDGDTVRIEKEPNYERASWILRNSCPAPTSAALASFLLHKIDNGHVPTSHDMLQLQKRASSDMLVDK